VVVAAATTTTMMIIIPETLPVQAQSDSLIKSGAAADICQYFGNCLNRSNGSDS